MYIQQLVMMPTASLTGVIRVTSSTLSVEANNVAIQR
jgi:hypothetical protein